METYTLGSHNSIELENCEHNICNRAIGIDAEIPIWDLIGQWND
jgi:hypothetical protein